MPISGSAQWNEKGSATAGAATATHAGEAGKAHYVTLIVASFDGSGNTASLSINDGGTTIGTVTIHDNFELELSRPLRMSTGNKAEISLATGGAGVTGHVFLAGFTEAS